MVVILKVVPQVCVEQVSSSFSDLSMVLDHMTVSCDHLRWLSHVVLYIAASFDPGT